MACLPTVSALLDQVLPHVPEATSDLVCPLQRCVNRDERVLHILVGQDQRREELDDVDAVAGDLGQPPVVTHQAHHNSNFLSKTRTPRVRTLSSSGTVKCYTGSSALREPWHSA